MTKYIKKLTKKNKNKKLKNSNCQQKQEKPTFE